MAKLSPKMWYLLKYGFLALVTAGIMVTILPLSKPEGGMDFIDLFDENFSEPYIETSVDKLQVIRRDASACLTNLSPDASEKKSFTVNGTTVSSDEMTSSTGDNKESSLFVVLTRFNTLLSSVNVTGAIIEPSILHCMIHPYYQELLSKRNFNVTNLSRSKNIVTYGIFEGAVAILRQDEYRALFRVAGFIPSFVTSPEPEWRQIGKTPTNMEVDASFVSHIFYRHEFYTLHVVVFYERKHYLWHAALGSDSERKVPSKNDLLFVDHDAAYEKFSFYSLNSDVFPHLDFYIPSTTHYFLFEMMSSRFLECNSSRALYTKEYRKHPKSHKAMPVAEFNSRALTSLFQLKSIFHPLLMNLWIWSGTMLGWYRECDIIPYTSDVDFAAWAHEVEDLDLIVHLLLSNKHVQIKERMGMLEEALEFNIGCHGLRTDVFFLYQINNGSWCSGHSPKQGYYFRYYYPNFTLCSGELLGEKVQVACETEKVILNEYGPGWSKPVSSWHYESSIKNRGPDIYWDRQKRKNAYREYH